eukprot:TRINITY_DN19494_c0_g2_i1.p1 TRINITY_DN19494_c0_g2~~TRINITY_DN19494_c0_g2_i1.p1  ORF type:complete len:353 (+),score=76.55 TRINITY_DN19494_c0_g2_i1:106-1059(+)
MRRRPRKLRLLPALLGCIGAASSDVEQRLYWTMNFPHAIRRSRLDGSEPEDLPAIPAALSAAFRGGEAQPTGLAVDGALGRLFFGLSWREEDQIWISNLDGSGARALLSGPNARGIAVDSAGGKLYWTDTNGPAIQRSNLDGSSVEELVPAERLSDPLGIAVDRVSGKLYWSDLVEQKIGRANLDGSNIEDFVVNLSYPEGLALDADGESVYWSDAGTFQVQRCSFDGTDVETIARLQDPRGLVVDKSNRKLYWALIGTRYEGKKKGSPSATDSNAKIQRANLDGSDVEDVMQSGRSKPIALALGPARTLEGLSGEL